MSVEWLASQTQLTCGPTTAASKSRPVMTRISFESKLELSALLAAFGGVRH